MLSFLVAVGAAQKNSKKQTCPIGWRNVDDKPGRNRCQYHHGAGDQFAHLHYAEDRVPRLATPAQTIFGLRNFDEELYLELSGLMGNGGTKIAVISHVQFSPGAR